MTEERQVPSRINETFSETIVVSGPLAPPNFGLYQPFYPLREADFLRLRQGSPVLAAMGGAAATFSFSYALPVLARWLQARSMDRPATFDQIDIIVISLSAGMAIVFLIASVLWSKEKRSIIKRIKEHFRDNPGVHAERIARRDDQA